MHGRVGQGEGCSDLDGGGEEGGEAVSSVARASAECSGLRRGKPML